MAWWGVITEAGRSLNHTPTLQSTVSIASVAWWVARGALDRLAQLIRAMPPVSSGQLVLRIRMLVGWWVRGLPRLVWLPIHIGIVNPPDRAPAPVVVCRSPASRCKIRNPSSAGVGALGPGRTHQGHSCAACRVSRLTLPPFRLLVLTIAVLAMPIRAFLRSVIRYLDSPLRARQALLTAICH